MGKRWERLCARNCAAGMISLSMTLSMAVVTVAGGVLFTAAVLLGSRHELTERGVDPDTSTVYEQFGHGMVVIDLRKAIGFTLLSIFCVVLAVAIVGWYYSRKETEPLEHALELQRDFVADASHELKMPLAVISTRIDLIDFRRTQGMPIDDALNGLRGDVDRMNAIFTDLLVAVIDNAVAHSPEGATVAVLLGCARHRKWAQIRVSDHGPGIGGDPERLFRRFARDDDGTAHQGYGLGLALARDVANRYGGLGRGGVLVPVRHYDAALFPAGLTARPWSAIACNVP